MTVLQTSWSHGMGGGGKIFHLRKGSMRPVVKLRKDLPKLKENFMKLKRHLCLKYELNCKTEHRRRRPLRRTWIWIIKLS